MPQRAAGGRSAPAGPSFPPAPALLLLLASLTPAPATGWGARSEAYAFHSHGRPWRHDEGLWRHFDWSAITTLCASSDLQDVDAPLLATAHSHGVRIAQLKGCYYREAGPATAGEAGEEEGEALFARLGSPDLALCLHHHHHNNPCRRRRKALVVRKGAE